MDITSSGFEDESGPLLGQSNRQQKGGGEMSKVTVPAVGLLLACLVSIIPLALSSCSPTEGTPGEANAPMSEMKAGDAIALHYFERVPYMHATDGVVVGLVADPAQEAFERAGVPFYWRETPPKRQLYIIHQNTGRDCLVGWFKNAERERIGKFTLPIYQDEPTVALARSDDERLVSGGKVEDLLADRDLVLLVKDGFSYGRFLDGLIASLSPRRITTTVGNVEMLKMIQAGRADYLFVAPEEAETLIMTAGFAARNFQIIRFSDMPPGEKRYIWCSRQVEDEIIARLDEAIRQNGPLP